MATRDVSHHLAPGVRALLESARGPDTVLTLKWDADEESTKPPTMICVTGDAALTTQVWRTAARTTMRGMNPTISIDGSPPTKPFATLAAARAVVEETSR